MLFDAAYYTLKDDLDNNRFRKDEYLERKALLDRLAERRIAARNVADAESDDFQQRLGALFGMPRKREAPAINDERS